VATVLRGGQEESPIERFGYRETARLLEDEREVTLGESLASTESSSAATRSMTIAIVTWLTITSAKCRGRLRLELVGINETRDPEATRGEPVRRGERFLPESYGK